VQFNLFDGITVTHNTRPRHTKEHETTMVVACTLNVDTMCLIMPRIKGTDISYFSYGWSDCLQMVAIDNRYTVPYTPLLANRAEACRCLLDLFY
jgi:hypothetical protein